MYDRPVGLDRVRIVVEGLDHPECVNVDADGTVWAGGEAGQLYRLDVENGTFEEICSTGGFLLGVTPDGGRSVYVCDIKRLALLRVHVDSGTVETVVEAIDGRRLMNPNYAVFDRDGRLYVSDSGHWRQDDGYIFCVEPDGSARVIDEQASRFPNGLALDPDNGDLYIAESTLPGVTRLNLRTGSYETVVELPGTVPDGLALDRDRTIYLGCYRPDTILKITQNNAEVFAHDPQGTLIAAPANVAFGGPENRTLYIASLARWHIGAIEMDVPGLPLCHPAA